ncbi:hypothetical protein PIB30_061317 [Stylosanthes scabra]|uniref:Uncharacterized protein n=1 Tax=Stylosanthes scabra TaxID=79078 RepID=A0ABU6SMM3_9FABA|nr:hypothetical protein [Stylosanthes scabra]
MRDLSLESMYGLGLVKEVNEGIQGINFPASSNSGFSVIKGCLRNTHVVKYWHMVITWKPPITMIEQVLGRYVASSGKYVLRVIRDIYWISRIQVLIWDTSDATFKVFPVSVSLRRVVRVVVMYGEIENSLNSKGLHIEGSKFES